MNLLYAYGEQAGMVLKVYSGSALDLDSPNTVLVNTSNQQLNLNGFGISKQVLLRGGQTIQNECNEIIRRKGKISVGQCEVTGAGALQFRKILHLFGPFYENQDDFESCNILVSAICNAFEVAGEISSCEAVDTVVLPLVSAGISRFPVAKAAKCLIQSFIIFVQRRQASTKLKTISLSLYLQTELDAVISELAELSRAFEICVINIIPETEESKVNPMLEQMCRICNKPRSLDRYCNCEHVCEFCVYQKQLTQCPDCTKPIRYRNFKNILCERCLKVTDSYFHSCRSICTECLHRHYQTTGTEICICGQP